MRFQSVMALKQSQKMSPQMIQACAILAMSQDELSGWLEEQTLSNPFLEVSGLDRVMGRGSSSFDDNAVLEIADHGGGLTGKLMHQLAGMKVSETVRADLALMICSLDDDGYLREIPEVLANDPDRLAAAMRISCQFSPAGLFATDLADCLKRQLAACGEAGPEWDLLLSDMKAIARMDTSGLARRLSTGEKAICGMIETIKSLDPRPGRMLDSSAGAGIRPDVVIRKAPTGELNIHLVFEDTVIVGVDKRSAHDAISRVRTAHDRQFINQSVAEGSWVRQALEKRRETMLAVLGEILLHQFDAIENGPTALRPLLQSDVAMETGRHPSTVSRCVRNKWIETPAGCFPLAAFFSQTATLNGRESDFSRAEVRDRVETLIRSEDPAHPLSDQAITDQLSESEMPVSRRHVATIRQALGIPSAAIRKRKNRALNLTAGA